MRNLVQILILLSALPICGLAQGSKVKYKAEGTMQVLRINGEKVQRLTDNVVFTQKNTVIYCDSSYFYKKRNAMEAFGRVRIVDDSVNITARRLYYDGNARKAELRQNVVYSKGYSTLYTDNLDYDMDQEISHYFQGGKLKDTTNTLESKTGYFYAKQNYATFKTNVVLTAPEYSLKSNDLHYNTITQVATTPSETEIITHDGETTLYADGGEFRTRIDQSLFVDGQVETPNNFLEGDDLFFDQIREYYKAEGNVELLAKDRDVIIVGDEGYNDEKNEISKIYGDPVMKRIMSELDTMYLSADTLVYVESEVDSLKRILAYNNVKIFKSNLQGYADSAVYYLSDSLIYMYYDPIMWTDNNQVVADTIRIQIANNTIDKMFLRQNSFVTSEDTIQNYNQIKGRNMIAHFRDGHIDVVDVNGNSEVIYYLLAEGDSILMGMNHILCSSMKLEFDGKELENITAYVKPEAKLIPPHELTPSDQVLDGFNWQGPNRPTLDEVLHLVEKEKPKVEAEELDPGITPPPEKLPGKDRLKNVKSKRMKGQGQR